MIRYHTTWAIVCQIVMLLSLCFSACRHDQVKKENLSVYFIDQNQLPGAGKTYTYQSLVDSLAEPEIWHFQKTPDGHLLSINYNNQHQEIQRQYDRFVYNGILTDSLILFSYDSSGNQQPISVKVISPNRFGFDADTAKVWLTHLEWYQPEDSLHIVLQRRRQFVADTTWTFEGKKVEAIRVKTEDTFETERDGWTTSKWAGQEVYAKQIGLVYYKRQISPALKLEFSLHERK